MHLLPDQVNERRFSAKWLSLSAALFFAVLIIAGTPSHPEAAPTFTTVDIPGAGTAAGQGTLPRTIKNVAAETAGILSIEFPGVIAGTYLDARSVYHGFYRLQNGQVFTVDAPGAGTTSSLGTGGYGVPVFPVKPNNFTGIYINDRGGIVGTYVDQTNHFHGFRYSQQFFTEGGTILPFDIVGAGGANNQGTIATGMDTNNISTACTPDCLTGYTIDSQDVYTGFYALDTGTALSRISLGKFGGQGRNQGAVALRIVSLAVARNVTPMAIGYTIDGANVYHALIWYPALSEPAHSFDAPGAGALPGQGTLYVSTDNLGPIYNTDQFRVGGQYFDLAGYYVDARQVSHGFVQLGANGIPIIQTNLEVPGAGTLAGQGVVPVDINRVIIELQAVKLYGGTIVQELKSATIGDVTGYFIDQQDVAHGFVRHSDGLIETFDAPNACSNGANQNCHGKGTEATGIDDSGRITGFYIDGKGVYHGFLRTP
jgi:hypothetical protein